MTFAMIPVYTFFFSFVLQLHLHAQLPLKLFMVLSRLLPLDDKSMGRLISSIYILLFIFIMGRSITPPVSFCRTSVTSSPGLKFSISYLSKARFTQKASRDVGHSHEKQRYIQMLYPTMNPEIGYSYRSILIL